MKNKTLAFGLILSALILPALSYADLTNQRIDHTGILSLGKKDSIRLEQHAGKGILLNKGAMEVKTEKVPLGFSVVTPRLVLKQNGETLSIGIPSKNYHNEETFTLLAKDSGLNYDLYLRKGVTKGQSISKLETEECIYAKPAMKCGIDINGSFNCIQTLTNIVGTKKVKNTYAESTEIYKLTFAVSAGSIGEFTSIKNKSDKASSETIERCQ